MIARIEQKTPPYPSGNDWAAVQKIKDEALKSFSKFSFDTEKEKGLRTPNYKEKREWLVDKLREIHFSHPEAIYDKAKVYQDTEYPAVAIKLKINWIIPFH